VYPIERLYGRQCRIQCNFFRFGTAAVACNASAFYKCAPANTWHAACMASVPGGTENRNATMARSHPTVAARSMLEIEWSRSGCADLGHTGAGNRRADRARSAAGRQS